jgi:hypothetical protein
MGKAYIETVRLLLEAIPAVSGYPAFAMKGGTAINLFTAIQTAQAAVSETTKRRLQRSRDSAPFSG